MGEKVVWKVAEFFSGIGGLHSACDLFQHDRISLNVIVAFEIDSVGNKVYKHNFSLNPTAKDISVLKPEELDSFQADVWLLSPPCQPYTRQGKKEDVNDPRAKALSHITEILTELKSPPKLFILENVVGFESSDSRLALVKQLRTAGYVIHEFHLSPTDFGIPNQRMRYFCVAYISGFNQEVYDFDNKPLRSVPNFQSITEINPISDYLDINVPDSFIVPSTTVERYLKVMDKVSATDKWSRCFTKSYKRYAEGTGSILTITHEDQKGYRYFTPTEIARLHCFSSNFNFPSDITVNKAYQLLGNSLNCKVVEVLLKFGVDCCVKIGFLDS